MPKPTYSTTLKCRVCDTSETVALIQDQHNAICWCVNGHVVAYSPDMEHGFRKVYDFHEEVTR